jgi:hypothetical protein
MINLMQAIYDHLIQAIPERRYGRISQNDNDELTIEIQTHKIFEITVTEDLNSLKIKSYYYKYQPADSIVPYYSGLDYSWIDIHATNLLDLLIHIIKTKSQADDFAIL